MAARYGKWGPGIQKYHLWHRFDGSRVLGEGRGTVVLGEGRNNPERGKEDDSHASASLSSQRRSLASGLLVPYPQVIFGDMSGWALARLLCCPGCRLCDALRSCHLTECLPGRRKATKGEPVTWACAWSLLSRPHPCSPVLLNQCGTRAF